MELKPADQAKVRNTLHQQRAELARRLDTIHAHARNPLEPDSSEQAAQLGNVAVVSALEAEAASEIAAIDRALERLDRGTWGDCERCGEPIGAERLAARPAAARCVACASGDGG